MNRRILLVEPDRRVALALERTVAAAGDQIVGRATHIEDALVKANTLVPDVLLIDSLIPGDVVALVEAIRSSASTAVVLVTASSAASRHAVAELAVAIEIACRRMDRSATPLIDCRPDARLRTPAG